MAFNEQINPINDQQYWHWSKPISPPTPISGVAKAAEGAEEAIKSGAKEFNEFGKKAAEDTGYAAGEKLLSDFSTQVEDQYSKTFPNAADSLTTGSANPPPPAPVQDGLARVNNTALARLQGGMPGHIRETEFLKNLQLEAQRLRTNWGDYRDQIDEGIRKATGVAHTANSYVKSMLADLNEANSKKNAENDKIAGWILQQVDDVPGADNVWEKFKKDGDAYSAVHDMSKLTIYKQQGNVARNRTAMMEADTKARENAAHDEISTAYPYIAKDIVDRMATKYGLTPEAMQDLADNKRQLTEDQSNQIIQDLNNYLEIQRRRLVNQFSRPTPLFNPDGSIKTGADSKPILAGPSTMASASDANKRIDDVLKPITEMRDRFANKEWGYAGQTARAIKSLENGLEYKIWNDSSESAEFFRGTWAFNKFGGQGFAASGITQGGLTVPKGASIKAIVGGHMSGTGISGLSTPSDVLNLMMKEHKGDPIGAAADANAYLNMMPDMIVRGESYGVTDEAKKNMLKAIFSGKADNNWLSKVSLEKDVADPLNANKSFGRTYTGANAIFWLYSRPEFVHEIERLSAQDPTLMSKYKEWMTNTFSNDLFRRDVAAIGSIQHEPGIMYSFKYGDATHPPRFEATRVTIPDQSGHIPSISGGYQNLKSKIENFNQGIAAMHNIYGENTSSHLITLFRDMGNLDDKNAPGGASSINGLILSIRAARKPDPNIKNKNQDRVE